MEVYETVGPDTLILPPFIVKMPSIVGTADKVTVPVVMVRLFSKTGVPAKVPAPANNRVPVPPVYVPLLVSVPDALILRVPAAVQLSVPLFVNAFAVKLPVLEKVTVPLLVINTVEVKAPAALFTFNVLPLFTVTVAGELATAVAIFRLLSMVVVAPVGGTLPPSQEAGVSQSVAPEAVI